MREKFILREYQFAKIRNTTPHKFETILRSHGFENRQDIIDMRKRLSREKNFLKESPFGDPDPYRITPEGEIELRDFPLRIDSAQQFVNLILQFLYEDGYGDYLTLWPLINSFEWNNLFELTKMMREVLDKLYHDRLVKFNPDSEYPDPREELFEDQLIYQIDFSYKITEAGIDYLKKKREPISTYSTVFNIKDSQFQNAVIGDVGRDFNTSTQVPSTNKPKQESWMKRVGWKIVLAIIGGAITFGVAWLKNWFGISGE